MDAPVRLSVMGAGLIGKRHIEYILAAGVGIVVDRRSRADGTRVGSFAESGLVSVLL